VKKKKKIFNLLSKCPSIHVVFEKCPLTSPQTCHSWTHSKSIFGVEDLCVDFPPSGEISLKEANSREKDWLCGGI
jgi:hypothetical protein